MEVRTTQNWLLRDLLHVAELDNLVERCDSLSQRSIPGLNPRLISGRRHVSWLDMDTFEGLPGWVVGRAKIALFRCIQNATRGLNPILNWVAPIVCSSQMQVMLVDKQALRADPNRHVRVILRAMPQYQGRAAEDCVKVLIQENGALPVMYFGKCLAFFRDHAGNHFVALRWFTSVPGPILDPIALMPSFTLSPEEQKKSYSVLPAHCILNGALMVQASTRYWAVLSPLEQQMYTSLYG